MISYYGYTSSTGYWNETSATYSSSSAVGIPSYNRGTTIYQKERWLDVVNGINFYSYSFSQGLTYTNFTQSGASYVTYNTTGTSTYYTSINGQTYSGETTAASSDLTYSEFDGATSSSTSNVTKTQTVTATISSVYPTITSTGSSYLTTTGTGSYTGTTSETYTTTQTEIGYDSFSFQLSEDAWLDTIWRTESSDEIGLFGASTYSITSGTTTSSTTIPGVIVGDADVPFFVSQMASTIDSIWTQSIQVSSHSSTQDLASFSSYSSTYTFSFEQYTGTTTVTLRTSTTTSASACVSSNATETSAITLTHYSTATHELTSYTLFTTSHTYTVIPGVIDYETTTLSYVDIDHKQQWIHSDSLTMTTALVHGDLFTTTRGGTVTSTTSLSNEHYSSFTYTRITQLFGSGAGFSKDSTASNYVGGRSITEWPSTAVSQARLFFSPLSRNDFFGEVPEFLPAWQPSSAYAATDQRYVSASLSDSYSVGQANSDPVYVPYGASTNETLTDTQSAGSLHTYSYSEISTGGFGGIENKMPSFSHIVCAALFGAHITIEQGGTSESTQSIINTETQFIGGSSKISALDQVSAMRFGTYTPANNAFRQPGIVTGFNTSAYLT